MCWSLADDVLLRTMSSARLSPFATAIHSGSGSHLKVSQVLDRCWTVADSLQLCYWWAHYDDKGMGLDTYI